MRIKLIAAILLFTPQLKILGQNKNIAHTFLSKIINHNSPVQIFNFNIPVDPLPILKIDDLENTFNFTGQGLTKTKNGLFLNPIGTGRLYKWEGDSKKGNWIRTDSTFFSGYNFLSMFFSIDTSLYSFGGIGFWHVNGNLRKYNYSAHEWNAKLLSNSVPWQQDTKKYFYVDTTNKMIYFNGVGTTPDQSLISTLDSSSANKIYALDINKGRLILLGRYKIDDGGFLGQTPWGTISSFTTLSDFKNNKIYQLSEKVENSLMRVLAKANNNRFNWQYSFWLDSALYFAGSNLKYDSVIIKKSDLIETNKRVYTPLKETTSRHNTELKSFIPYLIVTVLIASNAFFIVVYRAEKKKLKNSSVAIGETKIMSEKYALNETEKSLLNIIIENSKKKKMTSIAEINNTLGCANKSFEVQKRLRSDTINQINLKLSFNLSTNNKIIERRRTDFDARSFEYFIDYTYLTAVKDLLNSQN